jgi:hypothetical protein
VFATPLGTPLDRNNMTKRLKRVLQAAGLPSARPFHTLRHDDARTPLRDGSQRGVLYPVKMVRAQGFEP